MFDISYRAADANTAAHVANAIAAAYVADRLVALRGSLERVGGPYRSSRAAALSAQIDKARAAGRDGAAPGDLPLADARVLGAALPPLAKTYPKAGPTVMFADRLRGDQRGAADPAGRRSARRIGAPTPRPTSIGPAAPRLVALRLSAGRPTAAAAKFPSRFFA